MITIRCLWYTLLRCLTCSPLVSFVSYGCSLVSSFFSVLNLVVKFGVWGLTGNLFWGFFTCVAQVKLFPREEPQKLSKSVNYCTFVQHIYGRNIYIYGNIYWKVAATFYSEVLFIVVKLTERNLLSGFGEKFEFQFVLWASNSHVFVAPGHFFLILVYDCLRMTWLDPWPSGDKSFLIVTCPAKWSTCPRLPGQVFFQALILVCIPGGTKTRLSWSLVISHYLLLRGQTPFGGNFSS